MHHSLRTLLASGCCAAAVATLSPVVLAQHNHGPASSAVPAAQSAQTGQARARVEQINKADGKVKLKHAAVPAIGMPAMTMVFPVADPKLLDRVKEGEEVDVTFERKGGNYTVIAIRK